MRIFQFTCVVVPLLTGLTVSAQPLRLTVDDTVKRALAANPDLLAETKQVDAAQAILRRSEARFPANPYVSFGASRRAEIGGRPNLFVFLSQEIELGGQRSARIRAAEQNAQQESWNVQQKRIMVIADVKTAFVRVLARELRLAALREQLDAATRVERLFATQRTSVADRIEHNNAAIQLARYRRELWSVEQERDAELDNLRKVLDFDWSQEIELVGELEQRGRTLPDIGTLLHHAKAHRPDLLAFRHALAAADAQLEVHRRERIPNVTLSGSYARFESSDFGGGDVGISLPLFQTKEADIQEATAQRQSIALQIRNLERRIEREVRAAYDDYQVAVRELELFANEILPLSEENTKLQQRLVDRDEASRAEMLSQRIELLETKKDFAETLEKLNLALVDLERSLGGQLLEVRAESPPQGP